MPTPEQPSEIRVFAAACLEAGLLSEIQKQQEQLARKLGQTEVRWTRPEQIHVTLRFYGSLPFSDLQSLKSALQRSVTGVPPFQLVIEQIGCFPSKQRPSVIWLGIRGDLPALQTLQAQVEHETHGFGSHSEDREFRPHLTIARVKARGPEARRIGEAVQAVPIARLGEWRVEEITLMQSRLHPHGSIYTPLAQIALPGK